MAAISWVPSAAYQTEALDVLNNPGQKHGNYASVPVNPVSQNLVNALWPASALSQPAGPDTYVNSDPEYGYSYNWLIKLDHRVDQSNNLSFRCVCRAGEPGVAGRHNLDFRR